MDHFILERIVKKSQYQLYKKWTEAGVGASRATMLQERSHNCHIPIIGALLNERRQTCHTWAKEKNYWTRAQWSKVAIYQEILDHFMLSSAEKLYEDAKSFSSRKVQILPKGLLSMRLLCFSVPANSPDINPIEHLRKMRNSWNWYRQVKLGFSNRSIIT